MTRIVLFELSGGILPVTAAVEDAPDLSLLAVYFVSTNSDDSLIATTNFPCAIPLPSMSSLTTAMISDALRQHTQATGVFVFAASEVKNAQLAKVVQVVSAALQTDLPVNFLIGQLSQAQACTLREHLPHVLSCELPPMPPMSPHRFWCFNSEASHTCGPPTTVSATGCLCPGWTVTNLGQARCWPWGALWSPDSLTCLTTGRKRGPIAQELELMLGYQAGHTAPLLQARFAENREEVERRRAAALSRSWPPCGVTAILPFLTNTASHSGRGATLPTCLPKPALQVGPACAQVLHHLRSRCPYLIDRRSRGLATVDLGPDWPDQHACAANFSQTKRDGFAVSARRLLPFGLPPTTHVLLAEALSSPLAQPLTVADDLDFAIRVVVAEGTGIRAWRQQQWRTLCNQLRQLEPLVRFFEAHRSASSQRVSAHLNLAHIEALGHSVCWPDHDVAFALCQGVRIVGDLPTFGIYRTAHADASSSSCFDSQRNHEWLQQVLTMPAPPPPEAQVVWDKSEAERQLGILEGWFSASDLHNQFGAHQWRPMVRFAAWQANHNAYRCIDNAKTSEHNLCTGVEERIHTTSIDMGVAIAQRFRALLGSPLADDLALQAATKDMKRAYRQVPVSEAHLRFSVVAVWHPTQGTWVFGILHGLAFGLLAAVLQFNRFPALIVAVARRWLAIPVINFFDDFKITEPVFAKASGGLYFDKLVSVMGWLFDPDKDKPFHSTAKFLGGLETFLPNEVRLRPTPERESHITLSLLL
ncbi:unnamed protein product [Durusdinium trenchii]|uniref:Uncharacterized protein n=1 Tax=Durusdinium trenchii TaxID=1381693 RepID=A0ABP0SVB1_9DINO